ncbi:MAG TPA: CGNR zinc finger domain-containing protein [Rubrobacter sp.]|jgi:predicted RNA-binding Zn ribbon-like protein|nr:CGNR zinc finger domain-containing protein [Rubrobacter sp.]
MKTTTSTRASTAKALADQSPQRRPPRREAEPDAAVAAAISKSRTGRWCAMETCGNRHKTRRYRRKKRSSTWQGG